jgi:hypothetical protein
LRKPIFRKHSSARKLAVRGKTCAEIKYGSHSRVTNEQPRNKVQKVHAFINIEELSAYARATLNRSTRCIFRSSKVQRVNVQENRDFVSKQPVT